MCIDPQSRELLERHSHSTCHRFASTGAPSSLHDLFPPLDDDEIDRLELELGYPLPMSFRRFLLQYNGMCLFRGTLVLYGSRAKDLEKPASRQPLPLEARNVYLRPVGSGPSDFFIGHYYWDGSLLFMRGGERVFFRRMGSPEIVLAWPSLEHFLRVEIDRLSRHFDDGGNEIEPTRSTLPLIPSAHA